MYKPHIYRDCTLGGECINKFGEVLGNRVWEAVNEVFDHMPFAAVIDRKVFCCHGGIPPPWLCPLVNVINSIPCPLNTPDEQSALAWELMWNDPISDGKIPEPLRMELIANEGFATNTRRGTAHVWNTEALEHFLMVNNLSHVIRAHEMQQTGFQGGVANPTPNPQPGGPGLHIYVPWRQGGPAIPQALGSSGTSGSPLPIPTTVGP
ncbi:protein phosphatase 2A catalytic subunit B-like [Periplaneta americana]|uniref:protein phosphatase 2A catalytic subunit B-like n=1 Tax=Periplaneta americana TaxID=6978 RepID=UPI0037E81707